MSYIERLIRQCLVVTKSPKLFPQTRSYASPKRFYKNTNVLFSDGKYEITLDQKKLKTPRGNPLTIKSEPMAIAVATEWANQKDKIVQSHMHLSALCFTAIDNPNNLTKSDMVEYLINFLPTDTILFQQQEAEELLKVQKEEWDPLIAWFNERYGTSISKTHNILPPIVSQADRKKVAKYLLSHSEDALYGFIFAVENLKSVILSCAVVEHFITAEKAVNLAQLEEEFQLKHWGRVEWAHDLSKHEVLARLSAATLFVHFNRSEYQVKEKQKNNTHV